MKRPYTFSYALVSFFLLGILLIGSPSQAQDTLYTKDSVMVGAKSEVVDACVEEVENDQLIPDDDELDMEAYCNCVSEDLISELHSDELRGVNVQENIQALMRKDGTMETVKDCFMKEEVSGSSDGEEKFYDFQVEVCVNRIMMDQRGQEMWTRESAGKYCDCAMDKFQKLGLPLSEMADADDPTSRAFNEVVVPCVEDVKKDLDEKAEDGKNEYDPKDISGGEEKAVIPLKEGNGYRMKLSFDSITKYFLFDTGASDLIIDQRTERILLAEGLIDPREDLGERQFLMANDQRVQARMVRIKKLQVGDYEVRNVKAAVMEEGDLICGTGFFEKFRNWEFDKEDGELVIYK